MNIFSFITRKPWRKKPNNNIGSLYDLSFQTLSGEKISLQEFKGKKILIVNTASKCGYTHQYSDLQKLHEQYSNLVQIIGFPANNFLWQEPGDNKTIEEFCQVNFGVTFLMAAKTSVIGKDTHPVFKWLLEKTGKTPSWNFCKYLISENAKTVKFYSSKTSPIDSSITDHLLV